MKNLLLIITLFTLTLNAQNSLTFNKRFVQCEDQWVAFEKNENDEYPFGFIYIDEDAGLTFNYEGTFKIDSNGTYISTKIGNSFMKVRLEPNDVLVAEIPNEKFKNLEINAIPEWLKYYKTNENSIERLFKWGFMYNGWNECEKALTFLEKANKIDPKFNSLAVELAYSYNCLRKYNLAEKILVDEIKRNPKDAYVNKEYIHTLTKIDKIDQAINQYNLAKTKIDDKQYDEENCYNILQYFYLKKDIENFNNWYEQLSKMDIKNQYILEYAQNMKKILFN